MEREGTDDYPDLAKSLSNLIIFSAADQMKYVGWQTGMDVKLEGSTCSNVFYHIAKRRFVILAEYGAARPGR